MRLSSKGARGMGRVGVCLAFASSAVVLAGPTPALAQQGGQFTVALSGQENVNRGDADGQGSARLDLHPQQGTAC